MNVFPGGVTLLLTLNFKKMVFFVRYLFRFLINICFFLNFNIFFLCIIIKKSLFFQI
ncbi:hypothetical protein Km24235_2034 [Klebsiella michiganensis]|nr:hypothetical protein Km24235_2034 [Klebsiella michiganensis]